MATDAPQARVVFGGEFRPGFTLVSAEVEDHDRMIDKASVVLDDPDGEASRLAVPGTPLVVEMGWERETGVLFHGLVESHTTCQSGGVGQTTVVAYDDGILMHRERRRQAYTGTLASVVEQVLDRYRSRFGTKVRPDADPAFTDARPLVQADLTDYEFLNQLAVHYGARSFVEWDDEVQQPVYWFVGNRQLYSAKPIGSFEYCCGYSKLLEFTYERVAGRAGTQVVAAVMDPASGAPADTVGPPVPPPPPSTGAEPLTAPASGARAAALAAAEARGAEAASAPPRRATLGPQPSDKDRNDLLAVRDPTRILGWTGTGRAVGTARMTAKSMVTIRGISPWAEGDWYVGMATHRYRRLAAADRASASYETSFAVTR